MHLKKITALAVACIAGGLVTAARADDAPTTAISLPYGIKFTGHIDAGIALQTNGGSEDINFGQLFTDQSDSIQLNQSMLTLERDLDPKDAGYQWGFKLQGMYGTDARFTHFYSELDRVTHSPNQWDIVEAAGMAHLPWWLGGTDVTIGQYPTPIGAEVIDATQNTFYSHSYIFNYGLPFKHTGILTTTHVNDMIDIWAGIDTGENDSIGLKGMTNNEFPKVLGGVGLNGLLGGNLTILGLAHIGPEDAHICEPCAPGGTPGFFVNGANNAVRAEYDLVSTYKINDAWNWVTEANYTRDDLFHATAEGVATYLTWQFTDIVSFGARGEVYRDDQGFFVFAPQSGLDVVNAARGLAPNSNLFMGKNTYGEITVGAQIKPTFDHYYVTVRPELRWDTAWGGPNKPFGINRAGVGTDNNQVTLSVDLILGF